MSQLDNVTKKLIDLLRLHIPNIDIIMVHSFEYYKISKVPVVVISGYDIVPNMESDVEQPEVVSVDSATNGVKKKYILVNVEYDITVATDRNKDMVELSEKVSKFFMENGTMTIDENGDVSEYDINFTTALSDSSIANYSDLRVKRGRIEVNGVKLTPEDYKNVSIVLSRDISVGGKV